MEFTADEMKTFFDLNNGLSAGDGIREEDYLKVTPILKAIGAAAKQQ